MFCFLLRAVSHLGKPSASFDDVIKSILVSIQLLGLVSEAHMDRAFQYRTAQMRCQRLEG